MRALTRFESFVERVLEGTFARLTRSQLEEVEIARKLIRAMEGHQVIGVNKVRVPNRYEIFLNPADFERFAPYRLSLERELADQLTREAGNRGFQLTSRPAVTLQGDPQVKARDVRVQASVVDPQHQADPQALSGFTSVMALNGPAGAGQRPPLAGHLQVRGGDRAGESFPIAQLPFSIGRALDNDLVLEDLRVSRHHVQFKDLHRRLFLVDLDSTNGTWVNGERVTECVLEDGDLVSLGGVEVAIRLERGR